MTEREITELKKIADYLKTINDKLDTILSNRKKPTENDDKKNHLNDLFQICTQPNYTDKQYINALRQLGELPFGLSAKQIVWVLAYCRRHPECGEDIEYFIKKQFKKQSDKEKYVEQIASIFRSKYLNDNNVDFIEKMILKLEEI